MKKQENFTPLRLGQHVRISKAKLDPSKPARDAALIWSHIEGRIINFRRVDSGVLAFVSQPDGFEPYCVHVCIAWSGPRLKTYGLEIEILAQPSNQMPLFLGKEAA